MATTIFSHASIGKVKASTAKEGVIQCLGVQYATLADRFAPAAMRQYDSNEEIHATKLGPEVLSIAPGPDGEHALVQHTLDYDRSQSSVSNTESLCLNVTIPKAQDGGIDASRKLPVFTFIHGGGFNVGSAMYPQYDMARFVQMSVKQGMPIIAVGMNYRVGAPGLLTSEALRSEGYKPNNTFRDQRTALLWIQKYIAGFGGNPEDVTLMGESAGGISACYHLFSQEPLFKRMMSMSGTMLLMLPISLETAEGNYEKAVKALGIDGLKAEEQVELLRRMDGGGMARKLLQSGMAAVPVVDDDLVPAPFNFESLSNGKTDMPGLQWCEAAVIGDCQFDGNIQGLGLMHRKKGIADAFCSAIVRGLADEEGISSRLLAAYDLMPDVDDEKGFFRVLQVANDLKFYVPSLATAQFLGQDLKTYVYRFNEPNPWDGPWKGHATHILDLVFLLQNYNEHLDQRQRRTAEQFAADVISFVNGKQPWPEWKGDEKVAKVLGPQGEINVVEDVPEKTGRKRTMLELGEHVGFDKLFEVYDGFIKAPLPV